jgi:hypothetical protein
MADTFIPDCSESSDPIIRSIARSHSLDNDFEFQGNASFSLVPRFRSASFGSELDASYASIYMLDEDDDDSVAEADQEPAAIDELAAVLEEDVNLYSQEKLRRKKEKERLEKLEIQKMNESRTDVSRYQSPTRNAKKKIYGPAVIGKMNSPGIFQLSLEDDPVESVEKMRENKAKMKMRGTYDEEAVSNPINDMRPDMMRARSFDEYATPPCESSPPHVNNMRPNRRRGLSFDGDDVPEKPQEVKNAEEKKAMVKLTELLDQECKQEKSPVYLMSFSSLLDRYLSAVAKLRPQSKPSLVHTKDDRKKEANKAKMYDSLKNAWETYERTAHDKPDPEVLTPDEEATEEKVINVEAVVNGDWQEYAEEVVKVIPDNDGCGGDDERDFWILLAKRLKAKADRKEAKKEKRKKREKKRKGKEQEAQQKRLEAEEEIAKTAKLLLEADEEIAKAAKLLLEAEEETAKTAKLLKAEASKDEAKEIVASKDEAKEIVFGCIEEARRRQLAFSWYSRYAMPNRSEFKRKVADRPLYNSCITPDHVTPDDVDLLPWNATGSMVNIAKMNVLSRANITKPKQ